MAIWKGAGRGVNAAAAVAVLAVAGVVGLMVYQNARPSDPPSAAAPAESTPEIVESAPPAPAAPDTEATPETAATDPAPEAGSAEAGPEPDATAASRAAEPEPIRPAFDVIRVDPEGNALVAGMAAPGALVAVLIDGVEVMRTQADSAGGFVALFDAPVSDRPRIVALSMAPDSAAPVRSAETVVLAPSPATLLAGTQPAQTPGGAGTGMAAPEGAAAPTAETAAADETAATTAPGAAAQPAPSAAPATPPATGASETAVAEPSPAVDAAGTAAERSASPGGAGQIAATPAAEAPAETTAAAPAATSPEAGVSAPLDVPQTSSGGTAKPGTVAVADIAPALDAETAHQLAAAPPDVTRAATAPADPAPLEIASAAASAVDKTATEAIAEAAPTDPAAAPTVLLADDSGIRVLQDAGPGPAGVQTVAIDTITYDPGGEVSLGGRGAGAGFVRVYLDNKPVRTTRIAPDGQWRTPLPQVDSGVYTLRIDEVDEAGVVTSRIETPFKREAPEALAALDIRDEGSAPPEIGVVTVQPGNTLWGIATERYGDGFLYVRVFAANRERIRDPHWIYPGQVFTIPTE